MGIGHTPYSNFAQFLPTQQFEVDPDVPYFISANEVIVLMPIFRWAPCGKWIDAMGDYDLCMTPDFSQYEFINRRMQREKFAFRFTSTFFKQSARKG